MRLKLSFFSFAVVILVLLAGCATIWGFGGKSRPAHVGVSRKVALKPEAKKFVGKLSFPVDGGKIGSSFGPRNGSFHDGIDIRAKEGTPIVAAHDGEVVFSGSGLNGYGNTIIIRGDGILTLYAHNQKNLVEVGDHVRRGILIAKVGMTGHASGPHLHFETRIRDEKKRHVAIDPLIFFPKKG